MATAPIITVKLEASDEREAIARFIEYTFDKNWVVQDVVDAIRNGSYLKYVRKLVTTQQSPTLDRAWRCPNCKSKWDNFFCTECGYCKPPAQ